MSTGNEETKTPAVQQAGGVVQRMGQLQEVVPAHLVAQATKEGASTGLEELRKKVRPPRLKIVQKQSATELLEQFNIGDVILPGTLDLIAPALLNAAGKPDTTQGGTPFGIVPLFHYSEYALWNPYVPGQLQPIRERSLDPASEIARRARNQNLWETDCPDVPGKKMRYCEHLVFVVSLLGERFFPMDLYSVSFLRGSYKYGIKFCGLINSRREPISGLPLHIVGGQYELATCYDPGKGNADYWAFAAGNPGPNSQLSAFVQDAQRFEQYLQLHEMLKEAHASQSIEVDYDDDAQRQATHGSNPGDSKEF